MKADYVLKPQLPFHYKTKQPKFCFKIHLLTKTAAEVQLYMENVEGNVFISFPKIMELAPETISPLASIRKRQSELKIFCAAHT